MYSPPFPGVPKSGSPFDIRRPPQALVHWGLGGPAINHARSVGNFHPRLRSPPGSYSIGSLAASAAKSPRLRSRTARLECSTDGSRPFGSLPSLHATPNSSLQSLQSNSSSSGLSVVDTPFGAPTMSRAKSMRAPLISPSTTVRSRVRRAEKSIEDVWLLRGYGSWERPRNSLHGRALQRSNTDW